MRRWPYLLFVFPLVSLFGLSGCNPRPDSPSELRVGMDLSYPPFEMQNDKGEPDGVSVKIAEALAAHLGRPLKIVPMEFSGLVPALKTNHIDLILSSMTATDERRESIDFSEPYAFTGLALLVRKDSNLHSIEDLKNATLPIVAKTGTTGDIWLENHLPGVKKIVFEDPNACVLEVAQGRADAFIYDQLSIYNYSSRFPDRTRALLKPFVEEAWAIGLKQGNASLREDINRFLNDFRADGGFNKLGDLYLKAEKNRLEELGIPFLLR
jgi:polar amino acid transport system substrate-binding protein